MPARVALLILVAALATACTQKKVETRQGTVYLRSCDDGGEEGAAARAEGVRWMDGGTLEFDDGRCVFRCNGKATPFDTVYCFLGFETSVPVDGLALERTRSGEIVVDRHQQTATRGLYAIGDIVGGLNQISVAVGQAAAAATHAHGQLPASPRAAEAA